MPPFVCYDAECSNYSTACSENSRFSSFSYSEKQIGENLLDTYSMGLGMKSITIFVGVVLLCGVVYAASPDSLLSSTNMFVRTSYADWEQLLEYRNEFVHEMEALFERQNVRPPVLVDSDKDSYVIWREELFTALNAHREHARINAELYKKLAQMNTQLLRQSLELLSSTLRAGQPNAERRQLIRLSGGVLNGEARQDLSAFLDALYDDDQEVDENIHYWTRRIEDAIALCDIISSGSIAVPAPSEVCSWDDYFWVVLGGLAEMRINRQEQRLAGISLPVGWSCYNNLQICGVQSKKLLIKDGRCRFYFPKIQEYVVVVAEGQKQGYVLLPSGNELAHISELGQRMELTGLPWIARDTTSVSFSNMGIEKCFEECRKTMEATPGLLMGFPQKSDYRGLEKNNIYEHEVYAHRKEASHTQKYNSPLGSTYCNPETGLYDLVGNLREPVLRTIYKSNERVLRCSVDYEFFDGYFDEGSVSVQDSPFANYRDVGFRPVIAMWGEEHSKRLELFRTEIMTKELVIKVIDWVERHYATTLQKHWVLLHLRATCPEGWSEEFNAATDDYLMSIEARLEVESTLLAYYEQSAVEVVPFYKKMNMDNGCSAFRWGLMGNEAEEKYSVSHTFPKRAQVSFTLFVEGRPGREYSASLERKAPTGKLYVEKIIPLRKNAEKTSL